MFPTYLVPVSEYGFADLAQPRSSAPSNGRERLDEMTTWDLCIGSTGRAQGATGLHAKSPTLT